MAWICLNCIKKSCNRKYKYFDAYTHSVVRRIDERAMECGEERGSYGIN